VSIKHRVRRALGAGLAGAMVLALMPAGVASAENHADVCEDMPQQEEFTDQAQISAVFRDYVACMGAYGIARGFPDGTYRPGLPVTRQQMALFIARFIAQAENGDTAVPPTPPSTYPDRGQATPEARAAIDWLTQRGVVEGFRDGTYRPGANVTRAQMASYIARAMEEIGAELEDNGNNYPDVNEGDTHTENINKLTDAGIVRGFGDGTYRPQANVTRQQMAQFIILAAAELNDQGLWAGAFVADRDVTVTADRTTANRGQNVVFTFAGADLDDVESIRAAGACIQDGAVTLDANNRVSLPITNDAAAGDCVITFTVTYDDGARETIRVTVTIQAPATATATARPELASAQIVETRTTTTETTLRPAGTYVRFQFDEPIVLAAGTTAANFKVWDLNNNEYLGDNVTVAADRRSVEVRFEDSDTTGGLQNLRTAAGAGNLTLATVEQDIVIDDSGLTNPAGDAAIGTAAGTSALPAGQTNAPDLVNVSGFRQALAANSTAVDFTFDQAATVLTTDGFRLVYTTGAAVTCLASTTASTGGGATTVPGGSGTTVVTVVCPNNPGTLTTTATAEQVARGVVRAGSVASTGSPAVTAAFLQAHAVTPNTTTTAPELLSATFQRGDATTPDRVLYTFDQAINVGAPGDYSVYRVDGTELAGTNARLNPANASQVLVDFGTAGSASLGNAVGAIARAVQGANLVIMPEGDEVGVAGQTTVTRTPGFTSGPNLQSVSLAQFANPFGGQQYRATYTFDEAVTVQSQTAFRLYHADGTRLTSTSCALEGATAPANTRVVCTGYNVTVATTGGPATAPATSAQIGSATLGTVIEGAVWGTGANVADRNPEGSRVTTGGTGTPAN
jgi:hypothetical protein